MARSDRLCPGHLVRGYAFIAAGLQAVRGFSSRSAGPVVGHLLLGLVDLAAGVIALVEHAA